MNWLNFSSILLPISLLIWAITDDPIWALYVMLVSIQCALYHIAQILKRMHRL